MVSLTVYDGCKTIGGNKIYLSEHGLGLFLDFGLNFANYNQFYQEFLSERTGRGIHDLYHLGLIPKLDIYRPDLIPSDLAMHGYPKLNVKGVLLSHPHLDHCGNIGLLRSDIPVLTSEVGLVILKAMRDLSPAHMGADVTYFSPKAYQDQLGLLLKSPSGGTYESRDFYCFSSPAKTPESFFPPDPGRNHHAGRKSSQEDSVT